MLVLFLAASLTVNLTVNHNEVVNYWNLPHILFFFFFKYLKYICQLLMFLVLIVSAEVKLLRTSLTLSWQHSFFKPWYPDERMTVKVNCFFAQLHY